MAERTQIHPGLDVFKGMDAEEIASASAWWKPVQIGSTIIGTIVRSFTVKQSDGGETKNLELVHGISVNPGEQAGTFTYDGISAVNLNVTAQLSAPLMQCKKGDTIGVQFVGEQDVGKDSPMKVYRLLKITPAQFADLERRLQYDLPF